MSLVSNTIDVIAEKLEVLMGNRLNKLLCKKSIS